MPHVDVQAVLRAARAEAGVRWAVDGVSAVALHGLPLPHEELALVLVDDDTSRGWLRRHCANGWDRHGFSLAPSWYESAEQVRGYVRRPISTTLGSLHVRFLDALPEPVLHLQVDGGSVPVLALADVRQAHAPLDELLDRHEHRLAGGAGRRTV